MKRAQRVKLAQALICTTAVALTLSACGGSSNTSPTVVPAAPAITPPPPPPPPPEPMGDPADFRTEEYHRSWGLEAINAADAYAAGLTGEGVVIGVFDFNFELDSNEVNYDPRSLVRRQDIVDIYEAQIGDTATTDTHGHAVAVTAAGARNNIDTHGVAYQSTVLAVDFFSGVNSRQVLQGGIEYTVSDPYTWLIQQGARIVNQSLGYDEGDIIENPPQVSRRYVIDDDANVIAAGGLLVSSAGNNGDSEPSLSNFDTIDELRTRDLLDQGPGAFIIAGAVDENLEIARFSDRAGALADYYLMAPGVDTVFPYNGNLVVGSGTSFAAPHISGAAAILFQRWPELTARDVANILFESATDLGAPGVDAVYGHGLLNLAEALRPQGESQVASAAAAADSAIGNGAKPLAPVTGSVVSLPSAYGDAALRLSSALSNVTILDGYGRDFQTDLSALVDTRSQNASLGNYFDARSRAAGSLGIEGQRIDINAVRLQVVSNPLYEGRDIAVLEENVQARLSISGGLGPLSWRFGTGDRFQHALLPLSQSVQNSTDQLLGTGLAIRQDSYATAALQLNEKWQIRFGAAISEERTGITLASVDNTGRAQEAAIGTSYTDGSLLLAGDVGVRVQESGFAGLVGDGAFNLGRSSQSQWLRILGQYRFTPNLRLIGEMEVGITNGQAIEASIISKVSDATTSRFAVSLIGYHSFITGDQWQFTLSQPERVERANTTLSLGIGRDAATNLITFQENQISLTPTGRELALSTAYRAKFNSFFAEAGVLIRRDAGHIAGLQDMQFLLSVGRAF